MHELWVPEVGGVTKEGRARADKGALVAMSVVLPRLDIEEAASALHAMGFSWVEAHYAQLESPARTPMSDAAARVAGEELARQGVRIASFNVVGRPEFMPHGGDGAMRSSVSCLAQDLRWAAAMGAQRVLVWDGFASEEDIEEAPRALRRCIEEAQKRSELDQVPEVSVELHPFTFALQHGRTEALAHELAACGAGICLDFCHFGVALGPGFFESLAEGVLPAVNHVHFADSDCATPELHFPPGRGRLDLDAVQEALSGLDVAVAWDLFGWPTPRRAIVETKDAYAAFVAGLSAASGNGAPR
jgi:sugar phosphate isomerase/epimerase